MGCNKVYKSTTEMIESRGYLLQSQKDRLLEDLGSVLTDEEQMGKIIDRVFYKLFGKGWDSLTGTEIQDIEEAWIAR